MQQVDLREIVPLLQGLRTGEWLRERLETERSSTLEPQVLVLQSNRRDIKRVLDDELPLENDWLNIEADAEVELATALIKKSDVVIWPMTALNLFPAEPRLDLEYLFREQIPLWILVIGLGRLSDKRKFLEKTIPEHRKRLPRHSAILLDQEGDNLRDQLDRLVEAQGATLKQLGQRRRYTSLIGELREHLSAERKELQEKLRHSSRQMETARLGIQSLKIRSGPVIGTIMNNYNSLLKLVDDLYDELVQISETRGVSLSYGQFVEVLIQHIDTWHTRKFEMELHRLIDLRMRELDRWSDECDAELDSYFAPLWHGSGGSSLPTKSGYQDDYDGSVRSDVDSENPASRINDRVQEIYEYFYTEVQKRLSLSGQTLPSLSITEENASSGERYIEVPQRNESYNSYQENEAGTEEPGSRERDGDNRVLRSWVSNILNTAQSYASSEEGLQEAARKKALESLLANVRSFRKELLEALSTEKASLQESLKQKVQVLGDRYVAGTADVSAFPGTAFMRIAEVEKLIEG